MENMRCHGLDLLRIVAMAMVVVLHILGSGGLLEVATTPCSKYWVVWFLENGAFCAVNSFAMLSGYVGIAAKWKPERLIYLWMVVFFYSLGISLLFYGIRPGSITLYELVKSAFPVTFDQYWYFTAYFCAFLFFPFLNGFINKVSEKAILRILIVGMILFSIWPTLFKQDVFFIKFGYSPVWIAFMYLVGGYLRKYGIFAQRTKTFFAVVFLCAVLCNLLFKLMMVMVTPKIFGMVCYDNMLMEYTSPTMVVAGVALVMFFAKTNCFGRMGRFVTYVSTLSFSVYLIHIHPVLWHNVFEGKFAIFYADTAVWLVVKVLLCAAAIYIICSLVDFGRHVLFSLIRLPHISQKIGFAIEALFSKIVEKLENLHA